MDFNDLARLKQEVEATEQSDRLGYNDEYESDHASEHSNNDDDMMIFCILVWTWLSTVNDWMSLMNWPQTQLDSEYSDDASDENEDQFEEE